jgi:hypothetical protein
MCPDNGFPFGAPTVRRYDAITGEAQGEFLAGGPAIFRAIGMSFGPDGHFYLATGHGGGINRYDGLTGQFLDEFIVSTAEQPIGISEWPVFHSGEDTLPGWIVYLDDNNNGRRDPGERFTIASANGDYRFSGLAADNYIVRQEVQSGWQQVTPSLRAPETAFAVSWQPGIYHSVNAQTGIFVRQQDIGSVADAMELSPSGLLYTVREGKSAFHD